MMGTSSRSALPWTEDKAAVLDGLLGAGTYRVTGVTLVKQRGRWYEVYALDLYSGRPVHIYFRSPFPPEPPRRRSPYPIRTALADAEAATQPRLGVAAVLIGAGLLAAGYVMTRQEAR